MYCWAYRQSRGNAPDAASKQPYFVRLKDERPFAFAGLAEHWHRGQQIIGSCTVIITEPNELMVDFHDRMLAISPPEAYDLWLDPEFEGKENLLSLLEPYPAEQMTVSPVSTLVNNPQNESLECVVPVSLP